MSAVIAAPGSGNRLVPARVPAMPGLDGLRALAVAAVFIYHAEAGWLPGGFLGVDVFFVLSGYLITSLLLCEVERSGTVSLLSFWTRRARRLLPGLITVLVAVLVSAAIWDRGQLPAVRLDALLALVYAVNWHDALAHVSYFSQFGRPPLLRHLWSLSVEEQFYVLWPPVLALGARRGGGRAVGVLAVLLAALSALEMILLAGSASPTRLYEGTDTRAATLLIGAALAVALRPDRLRIAFDWVAPVVIDLLGLACAAGLGWLMVTQHGTEPSLFRGPLLIASLLAGGLMLAAATPGTVLGWALGRRLPAWLGRRSYEIYLWHWPVIALLRSPGAAYGQSLALSLAEAALSVGLAAVSFRLINAPIRQLGVRGAIRALADRVPARAGADIRRWGIAAGAGLALVLGALIVLPGGRGGTGAPQLVAAVSGTVHPSAPVIHVTRPAAAARDATGPVMVFGDSVAVATAPALSAITGSDTRFNAVVGRQPQDTIAAVLAAADAHRLSGRVVVSLGDNGVVTRAMLVTLRDATRRIGDLVLVTPRVPDPWGPTSAAVIRAARSWWPGVRIADWDALSADQDGWFTDGVHPDASGIAAYVQLISAALGRPTAGPARAGIR